MFILHPSSLSSREDAAPSTLLPYSLFARFINYTIIWRKDFIKIAVTNRIINALQQRIFNNVHSPWPLNPFTSNDTIILHAVRQTP